MDVDSAKSVLETVEAIGNVKLIVIDTLHRNMGSGDENSSKDFAEFLNNVDTYLKSTGAAVIIIHHSGHDAKERARGSSSIRAAMDVEYQVTKDDATGIVTLSNTKMKDFEPPKPLSFKFKQIQLDDTVISVVLETTEFVAKPKSTRQLSNNDQKTLTALSKIMDTDAAIIPPVEIVELFKDSPQHIPKKVIHIDEWRVLAYAAITVDSDNNNPVTIKKSKKMAFSRSRTALEKMQLIGLHGDYAWKIEGATNGYKNGNSE